MLELPCEMVHGIVEQYNLNLINLIYIGFTTLIVIFGSLIHLYEANVPASIRQSFRYGKHSYKGRQDRLVSRLEVPKGWFKHFYVFAFAWSMLALFLILKGLIMQQRAPEFVLAFLDLVAGGKTRQVYLNSTCGLAATVLITLQCGRRFYETNFVQIFSSKSKMNLSHYLVGYLHYFGVIIALLANTEGFVRGTVPSRFSFSQISLLQYMCIIVFHFNWTQQYNSNMILVNLRKDAKTGDVKTEGHLMPSGGFFDFVSSPHMLFEILMYIVMLGLMWPSHTWLLIAFWVLSNQVMNALLTHSWYKENFKNYPTHRFAVFPYIL